MGAEFAEVHRELLSKARTLVDELESIDPHGVTRENWQAELETYNRTLDEFHAHQKDLYVALYGETSAKGRIREFLKDAVGTPVRSETIARVSGISEYARRIRELRNEEGFVIDSTRTRSELGQNDYFVVEIQDVEERSRIGAKARHDQLVREPDCELCGRGVEHPEVGYMEVDHIESFVDHEDPVAVNDSENLRTLCDRCHHGKSASDGVANRRSGGSDGRTR